MAKISGIAQRYDGLPVDYVSIFNWSDGKCIAQVTPDATGVWNYTYYGTINCGITYVSEGCEPKTHGSYVFSEQWAPPALFENNEQGVWFDPSDISSLYQDVNKLSPVTTDGQPVALMLDKSGNNNHATQTDPSKRPLYRTDGVLHWLDFDGVSQFMVVVNNSWFDTMNAFTFQVTTRISSTVEPYSSVMGKISNEPYKGFNVQPFNSTEVRLFGLGAVRDDNRVVLDYSPITPLVLTATWKAGDYFYGRKNTDPAIKSGKTAASDAINAANQPLLLGRLSYLDDFLCKCRIYSAIIVNKDIEAAQQQALITYSIEKAGITV